MRKNVIIILLELLITKSIFNSLKTLYYLHLMISDVMKIIFWVNHGGYWMVVKVKENFQNKKSIFYEEKEMQNFMRNQEKDNKNNIQRIYQKFIQNRHWPTF